MEGKGRMICRKQARILRNAGGILLFGTLSVASGISAVPDSPQGSTITAIEFRGTSDPQRLEIQADGPLSIERKDNVTDRQVVLEIKGARLPTHLSRKIDTSSFNGDVLLVSPYAVTGIPDTVRVVLQLRESADDAAFSKIGVESKENRVAVLVPSVAGGGLETDEMPSSDLADGSEEELEEAADGSADGAMPVLASKDQKKSDSSARAKRRRSSAARGMDPMEAKLSEFTAANDARHFVGKKITLQVREMDVLDVLRMIGEASGFNMIVGKDVGGKVTLSLVDVPWDQALAVVLQTTGLGAERHKNVLRILTLENLAAEKKKEAQAKQAALTVTPRITRVFPVSYANLDELQKMLASFQGAAASGDAIQGQAAMILSDKRTNSLIVRDTADQMDRMQKLIQILDTQTPQVMIEGKVVEATEGYANTLSGSIGFAAPGVPLLGASFNGGVPGDPLLSQAGKGIFSPADFQVPATAGGGLLGMAFLPSRRVSAALQLGEQESKVKLIASPKTVVLNRERANIVQGTPVAIPVVNIASDGSRTTTYQTKAANLSLEVKPTVTNDGSVLLDLTLSRDIPMEIANGINDVANRRINTQVIVESGNTLVMGGFYTMSTRNSESGFPILKDIPILGSLFGEKRTSTDRSELFFFITPQIINPGKAGFGT